jgi:hypothetical protein
VAIWPTTGIPQYAMTLQQVEIPPPYSGDTQAAVATVQNNSGTLQASLDPNTFTSTLVHQGDLIQFNYQGPWYTIGNFSGATLPISLSSSATGSTTGQNTFSNTTTGQNQLLPWSSTRSAPMPYRIYRMPYYAAGAATQKSIATPLQLPAGSVIDLGASGIDAPSSTFTGFTAIYIVFSASGSIASINGSPIYQSIFLMVGKPDEARGVGPGGMASWQDLENLWVVINPQTGLVTTAPVAASGQLYDSSTPGGNDSRQLARTAQLKGGW